MNEIKRADDGSGDRRAQRMRAAIHVVVALQVLLWLYFFVYIGQHSDPKGDGMEWVAIMPATVVLALGIGPALAFRRENRLLLLGLLLAGAGLFVNVALLFEIAREFAESAVR